MHYAPAPSLPAAWKCGNHPDILPPGPLALLNLFLLGLAFPASTTHFTVQPSLKEEMRDEFSRVMAPKRQWQFGAARDFAILFA